MSFATYFRINICYTDGYYYRRVGNGVNAFSDYIVGNNLQRPQTVLKVASMMQQDAI